MKDSIIKSIVEAFKANKLSRNLKRFKEDLEATLGKTFDAEEFAEYLYDNEIKNGSEAVAGEVELANAFAFFTDEAQGGKKDEGPFWLNVWDSDTRLNYGGKPVELNELAHVVNLDQWKKDIEGHLKHNPEAKVDLNVDDAKFDFDNGKLHLHMDPADKRLHKGLREGLVKPSIEVGFPEYMYDSDKNMLKSYVKVKGLGLMDDGQQMGDNVGPNEPGQTAIGGTNMADENNNDQSDEVEKFQAELKTAMENDPKSVLEKKDEYNEKIAKLNLGTEIKTEFEKFLKEHSEEDDEDDTPDDKDELLNKLNDYKKTLEESKQRLEELQTNSKKKDEAISSLEQTLINIEVDKAQKNGLAKKHILKRKDMTLEEVRERIEELMTVREAILEGVPEEQIDPFIVKEKKPLKDEKGNLSDEYYKALDDNLDKNKLGRFSSPLKCYNPQA